MTGVDRSIFVQNIIQQYEPGKNFTVNTEYYKTGKCESDSRVQGSAKISGVHNSIMNVKQNSSLLIIMHFDRQAERKYQLPCLPVTLPYAGI